MYKVKRIFLGLLLLTYSFCAFADGGLGAIESLYALAALAVGAPALVTGILILFYNSRSIFKAKYGLEAPGFLLRRSITLIVTALLMITASVLMLNYAFNV